MELLFAGGVILLLSKMLGHNAAEQEQNQEGAAPPATGGGAASNPLGDAGALAGAVGAAGAALSGGALAAGTIAAGTLYTGAVAYASGELDKAATGDKGTGLVDTIIGTGTGSINPAIVAAETYGALGLINGGNIFTGAVYTGGRVAGRELDQALGGTGTGATGMFASMGLGITAATGFLMGGVGGAVIGALFFVLVVVGYIVGSIISDANRLAYGQAGAKRDYDAAWEKVYYQIYDGLNAKGGLTHEQLVGCSYPIADGYMRQQNRQAFAAWMKRGRGFLGLGTTDDTYHAQFGKDRGYFVGEVSAGKLVWEPPSVTVDHVINGGYFYKMAGEITQPALEKFMTMGAVMSNLAAYVKWMVQEPHGAFVNDEGHCRHGVNNGHFEGTPGYSGRLMADAFRLDSSGEFVVYKKLYEWWVLANVKPPADAEKTHALYAPSWYDELPAVGAVAKELKEEQATVQQQQATTTTTAPAPIEPEPYVYNPPPPPPEPTYIPPPRVSDDPRFQWAI